MLGEALEKRPPMTVEIQVKVRRDTRARVNNIAKDVHRIAPYLARIGIQTQTLAQ